MGRRPGSAPDSASPFLNGRIARSLGQVGLRGRGLAWITLRWTRQGSPGKDCRGNGDRVGCLRMAPVAPRDEKEPPLRGSNVVVSFKQQMSPLEMMTRPFPGLFGAIIARFQSAKFRKRTRFKGLSGGQESKKKS